MLVHQLLEASVEHHPNRVALIDGDTEWTYSAVGAAARHVAAALVSHGVEPGDRVAVLAPNSAFYVAAYYGVMQAGAVAVPLHPTATPDDLTFLLNDCGASSIVLATTCERQMRPILSQSTQLGTIFSEAASRLAGTDGAADVDFVDVSSLDADQGALPAARALTTPGDLASIVYTSGSTGQPRGVMLSHANLVANTRSIVSYMELTERDRALALLPMPYVFGTSVLNTHVAVGGSLVIENRSMYPTVVVDTLQQTACTGLPGVPSTFQILLDSTDLADRDLPMLRYASQAGGAMSPATTQRLIDALDGIDVVVMYGCTEASARLTYLPPDQLAGNIGKIGVPIPGVEIDVMRDDGSRADVDEVGELVARGPNIMLGYWGDPDSTAAVLGDAGLHTGDLAVLDETGYLAIVGRKDDMIKSGGHRISPLEIEAVVAEHAAVAGVAVVGVADELLGEAIVAVVVPVGSTSLHAEDVADAVRAHAAGRLPRHKVPARVEVWPSLPMSAASKVLRPQVRKLITST